MLQAPGKTSWLSVTLPKHSPRDSIVTLARAVDELAEQNPGMVERFPFVPGYHDLEAGTVVIVADDANLLARLMRERGEEVVVAPLTRRLPHEATDAERYAGRAAWLKRIAS